MPAAAAFRQLQRSVQLIPQWARDRGALCCLGVFCSCSIVFQRIAPEEQIDFHFAFIEINRKDIVLWHFKLKYINMIHINDTQT